MKIPLTFHRQRNMLFAVIATVFCICAANSQALAQKYKVGDRVECDMAQTGKFRKGTVAPFLQNDLDKSGRWYRVTIDEWANMSSMADGVECMATHMRPLVEGSDDGRESQPTSNNPNGTKSSNTNKATKYNPGDRVECDKSQIGKWEKGSVMHFLQNDMDKESGRYYRVRLDNPQLARLYSAGHECMVNFIRPLSEAPLEATGKYMVGNRVEAQAYSGAWLPAKITEVQGAFYKVRFDSYDSRHDEMLDDFRLRSVGSKEPTSGDQNNQNTSKVLTPKMAGSLPSLLGTGWKIDFGKGVTGTTFLFCKSRRWEIVPGRAGTIGAVGKSYTVTGGTLTTINADDGKVERWKMTWKGGVLELSDGKVSLRLHYNGETTC